MRSRGGSTASQRREFTFRCPLRNGLHARPATRLLEVTNRFRSEIRLVHRGTQAVGDAKSLLSVVALDLALGDECLVRIEGADAEAAFEAVRAFTTADLAAADAPLPQPAPDAVAIVPRGLEHLPLCFGTPLCGGIGRGRTVLLDAFTLPAALDTAPNWSPGQAITRFEEAVALVRRRIEARRIASGRSTERAILRAHLALVADAALRSKVTELLAAGHTLAEALLAANDSFSELFLSSDNPVTRERALDVRDICRQLLEEAYDLELDPGAARLTEPSVVVAETLTPDEFLALDRNLLAGLVLERAGATSHAMILAASFGIPTLTDIGQARTRFGQADELIIDANCGFVVPADDAAARAHHRRATRRETERRAGRADLVEPGGRTSDGQPFGVCANISGADELPAAFAGGAEGIGLFRTELLFMDRAAPPSEDEQFAIYAEAARTAGGRPVTIRTLDIGGDKPVPYLELGREANPFLGYRGIRIYEEFNELFETQLRAIVRASAAGRVRVLVPMVTNCSEVRWFRRRLKAVQAALRDEGVPFDENLQVGIMVEVPATVLQLDEIAAEVDFFSIGTNDLAQYFFAVDRGNERVGPLCDTRHPSFVRLLAMIVAAARRRGRPVSLCGEMGRSPRDLPLLIGLGLDGISVACAEVLNLKAAVRRHALADCRAIADGALAADDVAAVEAALDRPAKGGPVAGLCEPDLVLVDAEADDKNAAIGLLVDALYGAGRTDAPEVVEAAVWAREDVSGTAVGHGFAIPHCKSDAVTSASLAVLRLRRPIAWDDESTAVRCMVLLAIRASSPDRTHMRIMAALARKLMQHEFRDRLLAAGDRCEVLRVLTDGLALTS